MKNTLYKTIVGLLLLATPMIAWSDNFQHGKFNRKRHLRFINWGTEELAHNPNFFLSKYKITGVATYGRKAREGWVFKAPGEYEKAQEKVEPKLRQAALITPQHILMAKHYRIGPGARIKFLNADNKVIVRKVEKQYHVGGDVAIGLLETPLTPKDKVTHIPVATRLPKRLLGKNAFYFVGKYVKEGFRLPAAGVTKIMGFRKLPKSTVPYIGYDPRKTEGKYADDGAHGIGGDSGSPTMVELDGKLGVLGAHHTGTMDPWVGGAVDFTNEKIARDGYLLTVNDEGKPYFSKDKGLAVSWSKRTLFDTKKAHHTTTLYFHNFSDKEQTITLNENSEFFELFSKTLTIPPNGGTATVDLYFNPIKPKLYKATITAKIEGEGYDMFKGKIQQGYIGEDLTPAPPAEEEEADSPEKKPAE